MSDTNNKWKKEEKENWKMLFWELDYRELYEKEIHLCVKILKERENEERKKVTALVSPLGAVYPAEVRCVWGVVVCSVHFQAVTDGNFVRNHWAAANSRLEIQQVTVGVLCWILPVRTSFYSLSLIQTHMHWIKYCLQGFSKPNVSCYWRNKCLNSVYVGFILSVIICLSASNLYSYFTVPKPFPFFSCNKKKKFGRTVLAALFHYSRSVLMLPGIQKKILKGFFIF